MAVGAPREQVFAFVDEPARLAGHMGRRTWMMGGGRMRLDMDRHGGRRTGSRVSLTGRAFGIPLHVRAEVTERDPPTIKRWQTVGEPRLLVVGRYRMSVTIDRAPRQSLASIRIDYALPGAHRGRFAQWLARKYARWCVRRMASDVVSAFGLDIPYRGLAR
ncbi:MAG: SRPBCC family protein [Burkholderiales bacterium]|nr:SRPBCC family protein [Burkholderiales bacterium]